MKKAIVRFAALYVFNVALLLLVGMLLSNVRVGFAALWASVIFTLASLLLKPALSGLFRRLVSRSAERRSATGEKIVQYLLVYAVELVIWMLTVWFSGVSARGLWGFLIPPVFLLIGWVIYDLIDDAVERRAATVYDAVESKLRRR